MIEEYMKMAWQSLTRRKLRSWLTLLGIFIGIAAVVALLSLSLGMQEAIEREFEAIGSDKLFIEPEGSFGSVGDNIAGDPLTEKDMDFIEGQSGVERVSSYTLASAKVEFQGNIRYFTIIGVPEEPDRLSLANEVFASEDSYAGRRLAPGDNFVAALGYHHTTRGLYDGRNMNLNSKFLVNDQKFTAIGFNAPVGNSGDDRLFIMTLDAFQEVTNITERVDMIIVEVSPDRNPVTVASEIERSLARYRGVEEGKEDFRISTPDDLLATFQSVLLIIQGVLVGIGAISLGVGAVGIMNTMYTAVLERNKEIGIMKAIGAKNSSIRSIFLVESGFLGFVGGILGLIVGLGLAFFVEIVSRQALGKTFLEAYVSWELLAGALLFSFILGAISGTLPAIQASKLQPVETLRDE